MPQKLPHQVRLRKFPHPYKAAFTVCSDIDGTTFENFLEIHRFLNTTQSTACGEGLGLEIGDSFWFYSNPQTPDHAFAYFDKTNAQLSAYAETMHEFLRTGFLDVMHTYGNFGGNRHPLVDRRAGEVAQQPDAGRFFTRPLAEKALNELAKVGVTIRTWVNHGGPWSSQNVGAEFPGALGDRPQLSHNKENPAYHTDLLIASGVRFFWESENAVTNIVGQDRWCSFMEAYVTNVALKNGEERLKNGIKGIGAVANRLSQNIFDRKWFPFEAFLGNNDLLEPWTLRDGNRAFKFRRYGSGRWDWSDDIPLVVNEKVFDRLIEVEGAAILYVHLGDRRVRSDDLPLSRETIDVFKILAAKYRAGELWVTTTSRLLTFCAIRDALLWHCETTDDQHLIYVDGIDSEVLGSDWLTVENLQGLTFYTPDPAKTHIVFKNAFLPVERNAERQGSVSIPFRRLELPVL